MCGRYTVFDPDENSMMNRFLKDAGLFEAKTDIYPSDPAPIVAPGQNGLEIRLSFFGFPPIGNGTKPVINARCETADSKPYFSSALMLRRCVIPATGFYEWSRDELHTKYIFTPKQGTMLFMAGAYNEYGGIKRFVIFTRSANGDMEDIHSRMPVLLNQNKVREYILAPYAYEDAFCRVPPSLLRAVSS